MPDAQSSMVLLIVFTVLGVIVLAADGVIFVRWVAYLWAKYDYEERCRLQAQSELAPGQQDGELSPVAAEVESTGPAAGSAAQEDSEAISIAAPAPLPEAPRYPF